MTTLIMITRNPIINHVHTQQNGMEPGIDIKRDAASSTSIGHCSQPQTRYKERSPLQVYVSMLSTHIRPHHPTTDIVDLKPPPKRSRAFIHIDGNFATHVYATGTFVDQTTCCECGITDDVRHSGVVSRHMPATTRGPAAGTVHMGDVDAHAA